ncbi:MAG: CbiQ family ECF transporter T component [Syntrophomonas sp.]|nr:CbiQ family ECF transporter T component [Syntrophomonas sp.]
MKKEVIFQGCEFILLGYSADLKDKNIGIDAGIKLSLAILLAVASSFCNNRLDLVYFTLYLVVITILLKSELLFILKNLASYGIIFVFPYLCGLLLSLALSKLFAGAIYLNNFNFEATLFKMVKIFFIWYIGSLYFFTTPFISIVDMLNKIFFPLNSLGIPVTKHLNMIMCIMDELTKSVIQFKQDILEQSRHIFKNNHLGVKTKSKELSNILVAFIANSLQRTDEIQKKIELNHVNNYLYTLRISKNEIVAILSFMIFLMFFFAN